MSLKKECSVSRSKETGLVRVKRASFEGSKDDYILFLIYYKVSDE